MNTAAWAIVIFAHNEEANIIACLDAVLNQTGCENSRIFVLINGSRDDTEKIVCEYAQSHANVLPVKIALADKANAWNEYIHNLAPSASAHFFIDGDTKPMPGALVNLAAALSQKPQARAAGALPVSGRDRAGWSQRMVRFGRLAGCLYALAGSYVDQLRHNRVGMPTGLIGEDLFLSCLVKNRFDDYALMAPSPYLIFAPDAGFWFRSLSPKRLMDWMMYARRLIRYQIRDYQLLFLLRHLNQENTSMPMNINELYHYGYQVPLFQWRGRMTPFHYLALTHIRRSARALPRQGHRQ